MAVDYELYAKKAIKIFVERIFDTSIVEKSITYGDLAKEIDFPTTKGSLLAQNIGKTLSIVGNLLIGAEKKLEAEIPRLQALAVNKGTKVPSCGLEEFVSDYRNFSNDAKKNFLICETERIVDFGRNWLEVLSTLNIPFEPSKEVKIALKNKLYNPFGSEGSPEHRKVKEYIETSHHLLGYIGKSPAIPEYPLRSGDKIDVVFEDKNEIYAYEAKSIRSDLNDIERGIFQCVKYKSVIEAEMKTGLREKKKIICSLVTETKMPAALRKYCETLGIKHYQVKVNK